MKLFSILLFFTVFLNTSFLVEDSSSSTKGVYVISVTCGGDKMFKFPDDSIFVYNESVVEKILRIDESFVGDTRIDSKVSLDRYYIIDLKKELFRDVGKNLSEESEKTQWEPIKDKKIGFSFSNIWYTNEKYKMKDTIYNAKKVKKVQYQNEKGVRYTVLMEMNSSKEQFPVFFRGIEDKFKADVIKIFITYPDHQGSCVYTKKFIPLKSHEVFEALSNKK